jgi:hypothetical protein
MLNVMKNKYIFFYSQNKDNNDIIICEKKKYIYN